MRWSEAGYLSRIVLAHAPRQASVSLILGVRQNHTQTMDAFIERIFEADAEAALALLCPTCGKGIHIEYTPGTRTALNVFCPSCYHAEHLDGTFGAPAWVAKLGYNIITEPKN